MNFYGKKVTDFSMSPEFSKPFAKRQCFFRVVSWLVYHSRMTPWGFQVLNMTVLEVMDKARKPSSFPSCIIGYAVDFGKSGLSLLYQYLKKNC